MAGVQRERPVVLLIDEMDKADIEFPNDLLRELDRMEFYVYETRETDPGQAPPDRASSPRTTKRSCRTPSCAAASSTTSASPTRETMEQHRRRALSRHLKKTLLREALKVFFEVRDVPGLKKKPSTSELLDWLKLLLAEDIPPEALRARTARSSSRRCTARC